MGIEEKIFSALGKHNLEIVLAIIFAIIVGIIVGIFIVVEPNMYMIAIYGIGSIIIVSIFGFLIHKISSLIYENSNMKIEDLRIRDDLSSVRDENIRMREEIKLYKDKERELSEAEIIYNENITNYEGMVVIIRFEEPRLYQEASLPYLDFKYYIINRGVFNVDADIKLIVEEYDNQYQLGENSSGKINIPRQSYGSTNIKIQPIPQKFIDELSRKGNLTLRTKLKTHVTGYREFYIPSSSESVDSVNLLANDKLQNKLFQDFKEKVHIDDIKRILPSAMKDVNSFDSIILDINRFHNKDNSGPIIPLLEESIRSMLGFSNFWLREYSLYNRRRITDGEFINLLGELSLIIDTYIKICVFSMRNDKIKSGIDDPRKNEIKTLKEFYNAFAKNYNKFIEEINRKIPGEENISTISLVSALE